MKRLLIIGVFLMGLVACQGDQKLKVEPWGQEPEGVKLYTLVNAKGNVVELTNFGASLVSLTVPGKDGEMENVILGYDSLSGYVNGNPYHGATVGRYANRIAGGKFILDGEEYTLTKNNGPNSLHGGPGGFHNQVWKGTAETIANGHQVTFHLVSEHMEEGFPGELEVNVIYTWTDENKLIINYTATTDRKTIVNLTNHSMFNLDGAGNGDILGHELVVDADSIVPVDSTLIPKGELMAVKGTPFDFREARRIGARINEDHPQLLAGNGYDHCFVLNNEGKLEVVATLYSPNSGRYMEVLTDEPGVQIYTGNFLDGTEIGHGGKIYEFRHGIALETQHFPDSPNKPDFPSVVLEPSETYRQTTIYRFSVR